MNQSKRINVAAGVIRRGSKVLITTRNLSDGSIAWEFPGGKLEPGENPGNALRRELIEELEINAEIIDIMWIEQLQNAPINLIFIRALIDENMQITPCEGQEFRWFEVSELLAINLLPGDRNFAEFLIKSNYLV